jgi:Domain of unknown function (DUF222)
MSDNRSPEDRVADLVGRLNVVTAELVGVIGEVIRAGAWEGFGIRSPEHWVVWRCGVSPGRARRLVRMARALDALPATNRLFQAGELGEDQTALIVRHTDAEHDAQVAELAPSLTVPQLRRVLPSVPRKGSDPPDATGNDDESDEPEGRCRRSVRFAHATTGCGGARFGCLRTRGRWCRRRWRLGATANSGCGTQTTKMPAIRAIQGTFRGPTGCCALPRRGSTPLTWPLRWAGRRANAPR